MAKLYPPVIEGTIPAFNGTTLVVPFSMNRSVSENQISRFALKIKTVQSNTYIATLTNGVLSSDGLSAVFTLYNDGDNLYWLPSTETTEYKITPGQFYKIQLAYINNNEIGYFSTVGVIKYANIGIKSVQLLSGTINMSDNPSTLYSFKHTYTGVYDYTLDPMEKSYSYRFTLYDEQDNIIQDSGELLHNSTQDNLNVAVDVYTFIDDLPNDQTFYLQYSVTTVNGLQLYTSKIGVFAIADYSLDLDINFLAENNFDNGYINLQLSSNNDTAFSGKFRIYRQDMAYPLRWEPMFSFVMQDNTADNISSWKDFTIEHGKTYRYKLCQFNDNNILATIAYSEPVYADFEDMFLFDGIRQLKIQYNPKVASFKNNILESKLDTIGSKYPFFFRNGIVHYKEFPISGLISYWSDNEELFIPLEQLGLDTGNSVRNFTLGEKIIPSNVKTTDLVNYNIAAERQFKLDVLEWLTNGKSKLFRSPAEGNYIVRLLNTSLTPTDSLGRMLHSFNCTAYETDDCTYTNLSNYGFITGLSVVNDDEQLQFRTIDLQYILTQNNLLGSNSPYAPDSNGMIELLLDPYNNYNALTARSLYIYDCEYSDLGDIFYINSNPVKIGATQNYSLEYPFEITSIKFNPNEVNSKHTAKLTYSYYASFIGTNDFDQISDIIMGVMPIQQFSHGITNDISSNVNLIDKIQDARTSIMKFLYVQLEKRPMAILYSRIPLGSYETITNQATLNIHCSFTNIKLTQNEDIYGLMTKMPFYIFKIMPAQELENTATSIGTMITEYKYQLTQDITMQPNKRYYIQLHTSEDEQNGTTVVYAEIDPLTWVDSLDGLYEQVPVYDTADVITHPVYTPATINLWDYESNEDICYFYYDINTKTITQIHYDDHFSCAYLNTEESVEPDWTDPYRCVDLLNSSQPIIYHDLENLKSLYIGDGLIATIGYQYAQKTYNFENQGIAYIRKLRYEEGLAEYQALVKNYNNEVLDPINQPATIDIIDTDIDTTGYTWGQWLKAVKEWYLSAVNAQMPILTPENIDDVVDEEDEDNAEEE